MATDSNEPRITDPFGGSCEDNTDRLLSFRSDMANNSISSHGATL